MAEKYSQKEENTFRTELFRRMDVQDKSLTEITKKLDYTNGSVREHKFYFKALWWGFGLIGAFIIYIFPTVTEFVKHINQLDNRVTQLAGYNK